MGHAKIQMTQEYYLAAETQNGDRARDALNDMLPKAAVIPRDARNGREMDSAGEEQKR